MEPLDWPLPGLRLRTPDLLLRPTTEADLSAVEVSGRRTRLVARDGTARVVRGVRGAAQGNRFRARVLARAKAAVDTLPADQSERNSDG
jgi:hypothetical protein